MTNNDELTVDSAPHLSPDQVKDIYGNFGTSAGVHASSDRTGLIVFCPGVFVPRA